MATPSLPPPETSGLALRPALGVRVRPWEELLAPAPNPYPVSAEGADARASRPGLAASCPQQVGVGPAPEAAADTPLTAHPVVLLHPEPGVGPHGALPAWTPSAQLLPAGAWFPATLQPSGPAAGGGSAVPD